MPRQLSQGKPRVEGCEAGNVQFGEVVLKTFMTAPSSGDEVEIAKRDVSVGHQLYNVMRGSGMVVSEWMPEEGWGKSLYRKRSPPCSMPSPR